MSRGKQRTAFSPLLASLYCMVFAFRWRRSAKLAQALLLKEVGIIRLFSVLEGAFMSRVQWQERWDPFRELQREMGRLLEGIDPSQLLRNARQYPPINVYDIGEGYILSAQLPGVVPED